MFCPRCGNLVADGIRFCPACGQDVSSTAASGGNPAAVPVTSQAISPVETSGKAIVSLVLGLLSFTFLAAIPAVVFGHLALSDIKKSAGRLQGHGMAVAGLVLGYLGIVMLPFILIIAAIAIPNLLRARIAANEASAVSTIRMLNTAEVNYAAVHQGYTCSFADLRDLIGESLATGEKHGYLFELAQCSADSTGKPNARYQVSAVPVRYNQTGTRTFCSDETGVVREDRSGSAQACLESGIPLG